MWSKIAIILTHKVALSLMWQIYIRRYFGKAAIKENTGYGLKCMHLTTKKTQQFSEEWNNPWEED